MKKSPGKYAYSLKTERVKEKDFPYAGEQITSTSELLPSDADIRLTKTIQECAKLFDILVHDHLIVAGELFFSFREGGLM